MIHKVLDMGLNWYQLPNIKGYGLNKNNIPENHYKTIADMHLLWSTDKIYEEAFNMFLKNNYHKIKEIKRNKKFNLFID